MQDFQYEYYSDVKARKLDWLWYPYIPYGKLTVLQGDPGEGKSTLILNIAALLTKGELMPDGYVIKEPQSVIYQCAEDSVSDTIKPRLVEAGADCNRVAYIIDDDEKLTLEDERIEKALIETHARLFIIDPFQAFMVQDNDMQSATRMRSVLGKLAGIASKYQCAIVLVGHLNKGGGSKNLYRGLGSIDIAAIARSVLLIVRDKEMPEIRYMVPIKSSLAPEGSAIGFTLGGTKGFSWLGKYDVDITSLVENNQDVSSKKEVGRRFLINLLSENDVPSNEIISRLYRLDISERTVNTIKREIGIKAYRKENVWYWQLPNKTQEDEAVE